MLAPYNVDFRFSRKIQAGRYSPIYDNEDGRINKIAKKQRLKKQRQMKNNWHRVKGAINEN